MRFGFLLFDDLEELDLVGPWEMAGMWAKYADSLDACVTVAERADPVRCSKGLRLVPDHTFADCPPLDYLLVPGGNGTRAACRNEALIAFVRECAPNCRKVLSVCTGSFVLETAGLLAGREATTHWTQLRQLGELPSVTVVEQRWVGDDRVWTAAGVSAGIDMALALIAAEAGEDVAGKVQLMAEYYPDGRRYGDAHLAEGAPRYVREASAT